MFRVGRSDADVHTNESIHNSKYGDGLEGISLHFIHPYGIPSIKGVLDNIQLDH